MSPVEERLENREVFKEAYILADVSLLARAQENRFVFCYYLVSRACGGTGRRVAFRALWALCSWRFDSSHAHMIGIFDSGFGGLAILRDIVARLPQYSYVYLGDTARAPYGDRSREEVYEFSKQAVDFLFSKGCELVILACNTASSEALRRIQQEYLPVKKYEGKNVLGVIVPTAEVAAHKTKSGAIGVIGTTGTVASGTFVEELHKENPKLTVVQHACPALVPLIESGKCNTEEMKMAVRECLIPINQSKADTLILGCTHYGLIEDVIQKEVGQTVQSISEGPIVAEKLEVYLKKHSALEQRIARGGKARFYTTGDTESFQEHGKVFYGDDIEAVQITLE